MRAYWVYVFELNDTVASVKGVPPRRSKPYLYVGYTSKARAERLLEHEVGRFWPDRRWAPHFHRPRADLANGWGPYTSQEAALKAEDECAKTLRRRGYTIVNRTGSPIKIAPKSIKPIIS